MFKFLLMLYSMYKFTMVATPPLYSSTLGLTVQEGLLWRWRAAEASPATTPTRGLCHLQQAGHRHPSVQLSPASRSYTRSVWIMVAGRGCCTMHVVKCRKTVSISHNSTCWTCCMGISPSQYIYFSYISQDSPSWYILLHTPPLTIYFFGSPNTIVFIQYNVYLIYSMCSVNINSENMSLLDLFSVDLQTSNLNIWPNM